MTVELIGSLEETEQDDTASIQDAVDKVCAAGGGLVCLIKGFFRSGPLELKTGVRLHLESGVVLSFIPDFHLYKPVKTRWEGVECWGMHPLIFARGAENITLSGTGRINGSGPAWWAALVSARNEGRSRPTTELELLFASLNPDHTSYPSGGGGRELQFLRPPLVQFISCRGVRIQDLTLSDSPFWNTHLVYCQDVRVQKVFFRNPHDGPNTDGLNLDSCSDVLVEECEFDVGDDCLGLKSGAGEDGLRVGCPTENVEIRSCIMRGGHGAVVVGSETAGGIRNIKVSHCTFLSTDRGLRIKTRRGRGGIIENIVLEACRIEKVLCPVVVNCFYGCGGKSSEDGLFSLDQQELTPTTPRIRNIRIQDLQAYDCRAAAAFLVGLPEAPLEDIEIKDSLFTLSEADPLSPDSAAMTRGLPEALGRGIRLRYGENIRFSGVQIDFPPTGEENKTPVLAEAGVRGSIF